MLRLLSSKVALSINFDGAYIQGNCELSHSEAGGSLHFGPAKNISQKAVRAYVGGHLIMRGMKCGGFASFHGLALENELRAPGLRIGSNINLYGAVIGNCIDFTEARIGGGVWVGKERDVANSSKRRFATLIGSTLMLRRAEIQGDILFVLAAIHHQESALLALNICKAARLDQTYDPSELKYPWVDLNPVQVRSIPHQEAVDLRYTKVSGEIRCGLVNWQETPTLQDPPTTAELPQDLPEPPLPSAEIHLHNRRHILFDGSIEGHGLEVRANFRLVYSYVLGELDCDHSVFQDELCLIGTWVASHIELRHASVSGPLFSKHTLTRDKTKNAKVEQENSNSTIDSEEHYFPQAKGKLHLEYSKLDTLYLHLAWRAPNGEAAPCPPSSIYLTGAKIGDFIVSGTIPVKDPPHFELSGCSFSNLNVENLRSHWGAESVSDILIKMIERIATIFLCRPAPNAYLFFLNQIETQEDSGPSSWNVDHPSWWAKKHEFDVSSYLYLESWLRSEGREDDADNIYLAMRWKEIFDGRPKGNVAKRFRSLVKRFCGQSLAWFGRIYLFFLFTIYIILFLISKLLSIPKWLHKKFSIDRTPEKSNARDEMDREDAGDFVSPEGTCVPFVPSARVFWSPLNVVHYWIIQTMSDVGKLTGSKYKSDHRSNDAKDLREKYKKSSLDTAASSPPRKDTRSVPITEYTPNPSPLTYFWKLFLMVSVGYGVRSRKLLVLTVFLFVFSWLCVYSVPNSIEHPPTYVMDRRNNGKVKDSDALATATEYDDWTTKSRFQWQTDGGNPPTKGDEAWGPQDSFWISLNVHIPLVHFFARDDWEPASRRGPINLYYFGKHPFCFDYDTWASIMQIISYISIPLLLTSATGYLKRK